MQNTNAIIMIRPACFGWNAETAESNHFQRESHMNASDVHANSLLEFDLACSFLREKGLRVTLFQDSIENETPDSIFPNNWFSTHSSGKLTLYPMLAPNRRRERIANFDRVLIEKGFKVGKVVDFSAEEEYGRYLEGTGSIVLDRVNKIAYAAISPRTNASLLNNWAEALGYTPFPFSALDRRTNPPAAIYHTNVIMSIGESMAVLCEEALPADEAEQLKRHLESTGKKILTITLAQMDAFAGNVLELVNDQGKKLWVMSSTAEAAFTEEQKAMFKEQGEIIALHIPTIERIGGGSARCMIAENFLKTL